MGVCLTVIPVRHRSSHLPISKETPYRSTLRDSQEKVEPTIGGVLAIPEELETVILSDKAYPMEFVIFDTDGGRFRVFGMISQQLNNPG
ncbi:hypothetical protein U3516DRAFT_748316 [Neocallimastix sp. 'constans']